MGGVGRGLLARGGTADDKISSCLRLSSGIDPLNFKDRDLLVKGNHVCRLFFFSGRPSALRTLGCALMGDGFGFFIFGEHI